MNIHLNKLASCAMFMGCTSMAGAAGMNPRSEESASFGDEAVFSYLIDLEEIF